MPDEILDKIEKNVPLAPLTSIQLGGKAEYFVRCETLQDIQAALKFARDNHLNSHILGGGSNTIFTGNEFKGLVIKLDSKGIEFKEEDNRVIATAQAGEKWDDFVEATLNKGLAGLECLSGIPGSVGATPMQNVGAYGQSVADTITKVTALDQKTKELVTFKNEECNFEYRSSRFKHEDKNRYIIIEVSYALVPDGKPTIKYPELLQTIQADLGQLDVGQGKDALLAVREAVLKLRKKKSMVLDPSDPHSQSCGSFFMNAVVTKEKFTEIEQEWHQEHDSDIPHFPEGPDHIKIPAGWLVEKSGVSKGYRHGSAGISPNHSLALVNYGRSTQDLLELADQVKDKVKKKFGIVLQQEPILV